MSRDTFRACLVVLLITASEGTATSVFSPFLKGVGLGLSDIGFVIAIYAVVSLFTRIPSGLLFERWRGPWIMRVSLVLLALSVAGYAISPHGEWVALSRIVHGFAGGLATTVNFAHFIGVAARDKRRGRAMGAFAAAQSGGRSIGHFVGGYLADQIGFSGSFYLAAVFPILALLILPPLQRSGETPASTTRSSTADTRLPIVARLRSFGNVGVFTQTILGFSVNFLYQLMSSYFPLYALGAGLSLTSIGVLKGMNSMFGIVTRPFTGEATRYVGYNVVTNVGILSGALLIALIPSFHDFWPLAIILIMTGVVRGAVTVTNGLAIVEATDGSPERRGRAAAIYKTGQDMGDIIGPIVGGVIAASIGVPNTLRFAPWLVILVYLVLLTMARLQKTGKDRMTATNS